MINYFKKTYLTVPINIIKYKSIFRVTFNYCKKNFKITYMGPYLSSIMIFYRYQSLFLI